MANESKFKEIERIGFGVMADKDECPRVFSHSDRFLVMDLKNRKEVVFREYRPNPYAETCKTKYTMPSVLGDHPSDEEVDIYRKVGELMKDCDYVAGKNFGNYAIFGLQEAGTDFLMTSHEPQEWIDSLIDARYLAGYRD
ncbi:MAG: hypothetical protein GY862_01325 [Gammaproteobacteria bacterium]|nr:hypothetical protein [Gammaproteobacteria bacterium]